MRRARGPPAPRSEGSRDFAGRGGAVSRGLVYVVDRRTVVDQASDEADRLASALGEAEGDDPAVNELRRSLRLGKRQRLPVSTLRGQHLDNKLWLEDPVAPAIIIGTVDMIGSRLLFEGYGVSPRMRPVHAGLIGADALVMLDEAHLVPPLAALLRSIAQVPASPPVPRFHFMTLGLDIGFKQKALRSVEPRPDRRIVPIFRLQAEARASCACHTALFTPGRRQGICQRCWQTALGSSGRTASGSLCIAHYQLGGEAGRAEADRG